jgi:xanthine dehydrogenase accessory factor
MREVISAIHNWQAAGKPVAIATNVKRNGMSLRPLGAKMAMTAEMEIAGSVTGGCIEGTVYEEGQSVLKNGQPRLLHYGTSATHKPWDIGLSCGTSLDVLVESLQSPGWQAVAAMMDDCLQKHHLAGVATVISGKFLGRKRILRANGDSAGCLIDADFDATVDTWVRDQLSFQESNWMRFDYHGQAVEVFVDILVPEPRLIIIGASHIAIPLTELGKTMGYYTIVIDPREAFATRERLPLADELLIEWPSAALEKMDLDESCYVAVICHDEKLDNPALAVALTHPARYVGVLGTRKNIPQRLDDLRKLGVSEVQLANLHAPIGLALGGELPEEIALAILGEMMAARHGLIAAHTEKNTGQKELRKILRVTA